MSDSMFHMKLDRIIAGQAAAAREAQEHGEAIRALTAGLVNLSEGLDANRELLTKVLEAASKEADGAKMHELIEAIAKSLKQIEADGGRMVTLLSKLPPTLAKAAGDAVTLAMGDGVSL